MLFAVDGTCILSTKPQPVVPNKIIEDYPLFTIPLLLNTTVKKVQLVSDFPSEIVEGNFFPVAPAIYVEDTNGNPMQKKLVIALIAGSRNIRYNRHYELINPGKYTELITR